MIDAVYLTLALGFAAWNGRRLREEPERWLELTLLLAVACAAGGLIAHPRLFHVMRLDAWGVFVVMPSWCIAAAWITRPTAPRAAALLLAAAASVVAIGVDAFLIEPQALQLSRYELRSAKLDRPLRIGLVADLQTAEPGAYELGALKRIAAERPDVLLFAGDYLQRETHEAWVRHAPEMRDVFQRAGLSPPEGAWAVGGNVDQPGWPVLFDGTGITPVEQTTTFRTSRLAVTAVSFFDGFDATLEIAAEPAFHIAFAHGPDYAMGRVAADLLLAGHTHGGQVRLPVLNLPLITFSHVPHRWASGRTELPGGHTLIVSRGVGLERNGAPPLRFNCRPELVVIDVLPVSP